VSTGATTGDRPIVFVATSRTHGGAERQLEIVARAVAAEEPVAIVLGSRSDPETRRAFASAGARVFLVAGLGRRPSPAGVVRTWALLRRLRPRLVHVNLSDQGDGLAAAAAARLAGVPALATLHLALPGRRRPLEALSGATLRAAQPVIAVSDGVGAYLAARNVSHRVVRNAVPRPSAVSRDRSQLLPGVTGPLVGGIGRLDHQKGWDVLCAAAPLVRQAVPDAAFVVLGDGPERERLEAAGRAAGVGFHGHVPDASSFMPAFDVLVMPSRYEGLSLTAIEALGHGASVVASDIPGLREAVDGCGVLVPPEDPEALATAITGLLTDPDRRRAASAAALERARTHFDLDRMIELTREVHALAMSGAPATVDRELAGKRR
jgi:glycosyltransferase involved in cell wall biosynthesis